MSQISKIEWTDATWNPITGCTKVSPGCKNCYAERLTERFGRRFDEVVLYPERLEVPLHWRKPRRVFVNSMSDLFHEEVDRTFLDLVFASMALARQHTFQVLTKRPKRMFEYCSTPDFGAINVAARFVAGREDIAVLPTQSHGMVHGGWPLPNVWLGVSVEDQKRADERIPLLLQTPAAVRFLSCEPLLGAIDLDCWTETGCPRGWLDEDPGLDWVIVGGESGPGARPMDLAWARSIVLQCREAGVPCFVKQLGTRWAIREALGFTASRKGNRPSEWPEDVRVREWPA